MQRSLRRRVSAPQPGDSSAEPSTDVRDPRVLRALAHPLRNALLALLRSEGPSTASRSGQRLGESSGSTSYHLRQLALQRWRGEREDPAQPLVSVLVDVFLLSEHPS
jgi:DNA-binding transcriptional ArsR family regulator